jgi:hypothetical protein
MIKVISYALMIGLTLACSKKKHSVASGDIQTQTAIHADATSPLPVKMDQNYQWPGTTDQFSCVDAAVHDNVLMVVVQYGGGCEKHEFKATSTGAWAKSIPPIATIYIEHNGHNDRCRAMITDTLKFDASAFRMAGRKEVKLKLAGILDKNIDYNYK